MDTYIHWLFGRAGWHHEEPGNPGVGPE
jgi:hypothetical protein